MSRTHTELVVRRHEAFLLQLPDREVKRSTDHSLRIEIVMRGNDIVVRVMYRLCAHFATPTRGAMSTRNTILAIHCTR